MKVLFKKQYFYLRTSENYSIEVISILDLNR